MKPSSCSLIRPSVCLHCTGEVACSLWFTAELLVLGVGASGKRRGLRVILPFRSASPLLRRSGPIVVTVHDAGSQSHHLRSLVYWLLTLLHPGSLLTLAGPPAPFPCFSCSCLLSGPIYSHMSAPPGRFGATCWLACFSRTGKCW